MKNEKINISITKNNFFFISFYEDRPKLKVPIWVIFKSNNKTHSKQEEIVCYLNEYNKLSFKLNAKSGYSRNYGFEIKKIVKNLFKEEKKLYDYLENIMINLSIIKKDLHYFEKNYSVFFFQKTKNSDLEIRVKKENILIVYKVLKDKILFSNIRVDDATEKRISFYIKIKEDDSSFITLEKEESSSLLSHPKIRLKSFFLTDI